MTPRVQFCLTSLILLLITAHRIAGLAPHSSWTKLMIVSGGSGQEASVEVIDLSGAKDCPSRELKMPTPVGPGAVGTFFNGSAWVCGGEIDMVTSSNICFRFDDKLETWVEGDITLLEGRLGAAAVLLNENEWLVTGGYDNANNMVMSSTEIYAGMQGFAHAPDLEEPRAYHNLVRLSDTEAMIMGGSYGDVDFPNNNTETFYYAGPGSEWIYAGETLWPVSHSSAGFAVIDGKDSVVLAGGADEKRTQILDIQSEDWRPGNDLPVDLRYGASVAFGDSFLIVGGKSSDAKGPVDTIYEFNAQDQTWVLRSERLRRPRDLTVAFLVPDDYVSCRSSPGEGYSKMMVVGGFGAEYSVEVVDLSPEMKDCEPIASMPLDKSAVGAFVHNHVMVCGGNNKGKGTNDCWQYDPESKNWVPGHHDLIGTREAAAAAVLLTDDDWLITGGYDNARQIGLNSTEMLMMGKGFVQQADMPEENRFHNLVRINGTHAMALGSYIGKETDVTYVFNREEWVPGVPLLYPVSHASAAYVKLLFDQDKEGVLVAGGTDEVRTQLYNVETDEWKLQGPLPFDIRYGAGISYDDTMIIVGGKSSAKGGTLDTLVMFNRNTSMWEIMPQKLRRARELAAVFLVPDYLVNCDNYTAPSHPTTLNPETTASTDGGSSLFYASLTLMLAISLIPIRLL